MSLHNQVITLIGIQVDAWLYALFVTYCVKENIDKGERYSASRHWEMWVQAVTIDNSLI